MARASVMKASPRRIMNTLGWRLMITAITGSRFASARFALSQYSGFMDGKVEQQVLGLHLHRSAGGAAERQVDDPAPDVGAHRRRVVELQREDGEEVTHPALLDTLARPQIVEDGGRLGVKADMPGPFRLVDLAQRLHLNLQAEKMQYPRLDDAAERVQGGPAVGDADHRVVARLALPVDRGVGALEDVELDLGEIALRLDDQPA